MNKLDNFLTLHLAGTICYAFLYAQLICAGTPASDKPKDLLSQSQTSDSPFSQETHDQPLIGSRFTPMQGSEKFSSDSDITDNVERIKDYDAFGDDIAAGSNPNTIEGFGAELIKSSKPPGRSGGASHDHNNIPTSVSARQVLLSGVDSGHQHPGSAVREGFFEQNDQLRRPIPLQEDLLSLEERSDSASPSSRMVGRSSDVAAGDRQDVRHEVGMNDGTRDARFGAEKIRTSKPPGSGGASHGHNSNPDAVSARQVSLHSVDTSRHGSHPSPREDFCDPLPMQEEACICLADETGVDDAKLIPVCMMNQTLGLTRHRLDCVHKVGHKGTPGGKFGEELRKGSKPPGSGGSSRNHNSFPDSMITDQVLLADRGPRPQTAFTPPPEDFCGQGEGHSSRTHACQVEEEFPRIFSIFNQPTKLSPEHQQIVNERAHHQDGAAERVAGDELNIKMSNPPSLGVTSRDYNSIIALVNDKEVHSIQSSPDTRILHDTE